jgi:glyoxylase-like metal-dependent hydrolase (beta-lactamase superfamily II)
MLRISATRRRLRLPSFRQKAYYRLVGSPVRISGSNDDLSHETLSTQVNAVTKEAMKVHALSGYVSTLFLCQYPEREGANTFVLDCGTPIDSNRVAYFLGNHNLPHSAKPGDGTDDVSQAALKRLIKLAVATHAHPDHGGAARVYAAKGIDVAAPRYINRYYSGIGGYAQLVAERFLMAAFAFMLGRTRIERLNITGRVPVSKHIPRLEDGRHLPHGFDDWQSVAIHGHTGHMVGLFHAASGVFYAADLIIKHKSRFLGPMPIDMPEEYLATIERLRTLPVRWLLLAHGGITDIDDIAGGWNYVLDQAAAHCRSDLYSPMMQLLRPLARLGPEPKLYKRETERPREAIVVSDLEPVPVCHLK